MAAIRQQWPKRVSRIEVQSGEKPRVGVKLYSSSLTTPGLMFIQTKSWSPVGHACHRARAVGLPTKSRKTVHQPRISSPGPTFVAVGQKYSAGLNVPSGRASMEAFVYQSPTATTIWTMRTSIVAPASMLYQTTTVRYPNMLNQDNPEL